MGDDEVLDRLESLIGRLERAASMIAESEKRFSQNAEAMRERDRAAALDAWRRGR
ncbi:hypothetical protein J2W21_001780 [Sinomonas atrocyanea]|uniref:hypothetical protein n=1 Tax=Sinomonas atrocyanea TaxID=37927 RepID=UPI00278A1321|nr:hypothetical protein [Sinomonas atrocyanea]MDP9884270.1 hypothetical protein [Sinomonas atrocyanea]